MAKWLLLLLVLDGPVRAPPLVLSLPVLRYIHYLTYILLFTYTDTCIQQHNDVCRQQHSVLHTLTNYLHILSQSSHTEGQRHPLGPRCLDNTHRW